MYSPSSSNAPIVFILIIAVALLGTLWLYARYTRLRGPKAVLAWLLTTMAAAAFALYQFRKVDQIRARGFHSALNRDDVAVVAIASGVLILFSVAFAIRLYRKWLDADLTEEERAGGTRGPRLAEPRKSLRRGRNFLPGMVQPRLAPRAHAGRHRWRAHRLACFAR